MIATVLAFADTDPFGQPARGVLDDLAHVLPDCRTVVIAPGDAVPMATRPEGRLICVGIGAGARAALLAGRRLGADAIVAWAPTGRISGTDAPDEAALTTAFADRTLDRADQAIHLAAVADTVEPDLALVRRLAGPSLGVRIDRNDALVYAALSILLRQTGALAAAVRAAVDGTVPPKLHDLPERWQRAFPHRLTLDIASAWSDAPGAVHLPGTFHWDGDTTLDLAALSAEHVLIGLRIGVPGDPPSRIGSARAAFARRHLAPGETMPFSLTLAPSLAARGGQIEVALVAERSFWFDPHGFAVARLWVDAARVATAA